MDKLGDGLLDRIRINLPRAGVESFERFAILAFLPRFAGLAFVALRLVEFICQGPQPIARFARPCRRESSRVQSTACLVELE